nr:uncharacterized protein LOC126524760 [Dermacentor andersoni]
MVGPAISTSNVSPETSAVRESTTGHRATRPAEDVDTRWSVAVAASFIAFFTVASSSNLGFFFVYFLEEFHTTREKASWPGSVLQIMGHVSGILVALLQPFFSTFHIAFAGSMLLWLGLLAAVFAPSIPWMTVTFGFLHGAGMGIVSVAVIVALMTHFDKYRGVAAGFKYTGNTMATLLLPKFLSWLQEVFSFRGTLLIYAALIMNATAFTIFLRDRKIVTNEKRRSQSNQEEFLKGVKVGVSAKNSPVVDHNGRCLVNWKPRGACEKNLNDTAETSSLRVDHKDYSTCHSPGKAEKPEHVKPEIITASKYDIVEILQAGDVHRTCHSAQEHGIVVAKHEQDFSNEGALPDLITKAEEKKKGCGKWLRRPSGNKEKQSKRILTEKNVSRKQKHDVNTGTAYEETTADRRLPDPSHQPRICHSGTLEVLSKPTFYVLVLGAVAADYTVLVVHGTVIDYALDKGVERKSAELSMTYCAGTEFIGRLLLPLVADFRFVGRTNLVALCFVAMAVMSLALPFTASFLSYISVQVTAALFLACVTTFKGVLVADNFGAKAVPTFWGANGLALIPLLSGNPFITGLFRDTMGSYDNLLRLLGGIQLFTAAAFFTLAYVQKRRSKMSS